MLEKLTDTELQEHYAKAKISRQQATDLHRALASEVDRRARLAIEADELRKVSEKIGKKVQVVGPLGSDQGVVGTPGV